MAGKRRVPALIAFAGAAAALVGALTITVQAWNLFTRLGNGEFWDG